MKESNLAELMGEERQGIFDKRKVSSNVKEVHVRTCKQDDC